MIRALGLCAAGAFHALAFAPEPLPSFVLPVVQLLALAVLAAAVWHTPTAGRAAWAGFWFGLGNFAAGLYWVFISLHVYGQMVAPLAVLAVLALAALLALFPALASAVARWLVPCRRETVLPWQFALAFAAAWTAAEWLRGTVFTGFPWLNVGYAHVEGWLAGWAPVLGVYGVAWWAAWSSAVLLGLWQSRGARLEQRVGWSVALVVPWLVGLGLIQNPWGVEDYGDPLAIRLVQGNVAQSNKFDPDLIVSTLDRHVALAGRPSVIPGFRPEVVILPETAIPLFQDQMPVPLWQPWRDVAGYWGGTVVTGIAMHTAVPDGGSRFTNSVIGFDSDSSAFSLKNGRVPWRYDKAHLVPFGEFVPPGFRWFVNQMIMPMGDFDRGAQRQQPFALGDQHVGFNICYEDIFGEELLPAVRSDGTKAPGATILANVSNLGWFGHSSALRQHWQIARMRSIETARPTVRATNTGMTGLIDHKGQVLALLPAHTVDVLDIEVQGKTGLTPYVRWGNTTILIVLALVLLGLLRWRRQVSQGH